MTAGDTPTHPPPPAARLLSALPSIVMLATGLPFIISWWARWDSAVHTAIAWRMAQTGDFLAMWAGDSLYFNKPPLGIWVLAGVFRAGLAAGLLSAAEGPPIWLVRAPSLLAACLCVRVLVAIVTRTHGLTAAMTAGCVLALTQPFMVLLNEKVVDFWHLLFMLCVVWCWVRATETPQRVRWMLTAAIPLGLALLCKPMGALLVLPLGAAWLIATKRWRLLLPLLASGVLALVVAAPWYLAMHARFGDAFLQAHFGREVIARLEGRKFTPEPWWWYGWWFAKAYWPWLGVLVVAPFVLAARARRAPAPPLDAEHRPLLLPLIWTIGWLLVLSCASDKRTAYAMPVYASLAWTCGVLLVRLFPALHAPGVRRIGTIAALTLLTASACAVAWLARRGPDGAGAALRPVIAAIRQAQPVNVYTGALRHVDAANIYLRCGQWPTGSMNDGELDIAADAPSIHDPTYRPPAAPGDLVVYRDDYAQSPPPDADVVLRAAPFTVVRWPTRLSPP